MPFSKGDQNINRNGRPKGVANKISEELRESFAQMLDNNMDHFEEWIARVAEKDPAKAMELYIKVSERFIPALGRQEITGADGKDLKFEFKFGQKFDDNAPE